LLVVISIIALLISILLPALGAARAASRNVKCQTQLHGAGIAIHMYVNDNKNIMPQPSSWSPPTGPLVYPTGYNGLMGCWGTPTNCYYPWQAFVFNYAPDIRQWIDPANQWPADQYTENPAGVTGDCAGEPLPGLDGALWWGNYGCNAAVFSYLDWVKMDAQLEPSNTAAVADAGGYEFDTTYPGFNAGYYYLPGAAPPAWTTLGVTALDPLRQADCDLGRHPARSVNSMLLDGHVRANSATDLYNGYLDYVASGYVTNTELSVWWTGRIATP
jgi:type II secretory pathway pseudopilin PulG